MAGFVTDPYAGNLGGLHGKTLTFALFTSAAEPSRAGGPLSGLTGEVSTSTAPGYTRRTSTASWSNGQLRAGTSPVFEALGAPDIKHLVVAEAGQIVAVLSLPNPVAGANSYKPLVDGVIAAPVWYDGVEQVDPGDGIDITGSPVVPVVEVDGTVIREGDNRLTNARTPTAHTHPASQISDATTVGRNVLTASSQANARNAIAAVSTSDSRLSDARVPTAHTHPAADISDSTATGRNVLTASSQATARTAIGAASSAQAVPAGGATGQVLAKTSGSDYATGWVDQSGGGGGGPITSADITDSTATGRSVLTASTQAAARSAIGAEESGAASSAVSSHNSATNAHGQTTVGRSVLTASSQANARNAIAAVGNEGSVSGIRRMTQTAYDALGTKNAETLYVIVD